MTIQFTQTALSDIHSISKYLLQESTESVLSTILARIYAGIESIAEFPELGKTGRVIGTRELVLYQLLFIIVYRIAKDELQILSILHAGRHWPAI